MFENNCKKKQNHEIFLLDNPKICRLPLKDILCYIMNMKKLRGDFYFEPAVPLASSGWRVVN